MTRPWVTPTEVKAYTDIKEVQERSEDKLKVDIMRAEEYVINVTHNDFSDEAYATAMPDSVKTAIILLSEAYANNAIRQKKRNVKSETFDDYAYTASDSAEISVSDVDISSLLEPYMKYKASGSTFLRMRKL